MVKQPKDNDLEDISRLIKRAEPIILKYLEVNKPVVKRTQIMNFIIMMTLCLGIISLAIYNKIDGSAATGLIGAIIGYVFGSLYKTKA